MNPNVTASPSRLSAFWRFVTTNRKVTIGMVIVAFFVLVAVFGPLLIHQDPTEFTEDLLQPPSTAHWLGTTQNGQDVFAQLVVGTRVSVALGFIVGMLTTAVSVVVGVVSGYLTRCAGFSERKDPGAEGVSSSEIVATALRRAPWTWMTSLSPSFVGLTRPSPA